MDRTHPVNGDRVSRSCRVSGRFLRPRRVAQLGQNSVVLGASRRRGCKAPSTARADSGQPRHGGTPVESDSDEEEIPILVPICAKSTQSSFSNGSKKTRKRSPSSEGHAGPSCSLAKRASKEKPRKNRKRKLGIPENLQLHPMETRARKRKREAESEELRKKETLPARRTNPERRVSFASRYSVGDLLGKGGCGSVYAGVRKADGKQVAIKYVPKDVTEPYITVPGETRRLPLEVALMEIVCKPPQCEHIVELLEWFEMPNCFILILERPIPSIDLYSFCKLHKGRLSEPLARVIMLQVVRAILHCRDRGVLHRDIKDENILVKIDTLDVKLIDFGCGDLLKTTPYRIYAGTREFCPPEWLLKGKYEGRPATIWSLGVLLFNMICGELPYEKERDIVEGHLQFKCRPSKACRHLIRWCLEQEPENRPVLEDILAHDWFSEGLQS